MLLAIAHCIAPVAWSDSIGEEMGASAGKISDSVTSVYQTVESSALNSVESIGVHAESLQRSANNLAADINQDYHNFIYDFQKGYYK